ncbi:hypothetical protein RI367_007952 [Sorochytrium milnesiophthora]
MCTPQQQVVIHDDGDNKATAGTLNLSGGIAIIAGCMIGTGVFSIGGLVLMNVGSPGMAICMWALGGLVSFFGGFTYIEWGLMIPASGGDMPYLEYAYRHPRQLLSFLYSWARILLVHTGYSAGLAVAASKNILCGFLDTNIQIEDLALKQKEATRQALIRKVVAVSVLTLVILVCAVSNRFANASMKLITAVKICVLAFVVVTGIVILAGGFPSVPSRLLPIGEAFDGTSAHPAGYANALYFIFFCYDGWAYLGSCIDELQHPRRDVPRAIIGGCTIVSTLYVLANIAYFTGLEPAHVQNIGEELAVEFTARAWGATFGRQVFNWFVGLSAFGACLSITYAASRVTVAAAERRYLPGARYLQQFSPRLGTPLYALGLHYVISLVMVVATTDDAFQFLIKMSSFPVWVFYTITAIGLLLVRWREPAKERPFRVILLCPVVVIIVGMFLVVFPFVNGGMDRIAACVGLGAIALGVPAYYLMVYRKIQKTA